MLTLIHSSVTRAPGHTALRWKQDGAYLEMTYGELWNQVQSLAYALQELGVKPDSKVAILSNNRSEWTVSDLAIMMCGAVSVPIYATVTAQQVAFILQNADVEGIIVEDADQMEKTLSVRTAMLHTLVCTQPTDRSAQPGITTFQDLIDHGAVLLREQGPFSAWETIDEHSLATIVHTSGTTGNPKGVMLSHRNLMDNALFTLQHVPISPEDRTLSYLPLSHIFERTAGQFGMLISGATISFAESLATIPQNLLEVRPTVMTSVPRLFEKIHDGVWKMINESSKSKQFIFRYALSLGRKRLQGETLLTRLLHPLLDRLVFAKIRERMGGNMRLLVSGGAPLSPTVGEFLQIAGLNVCEGYGMTESSPVISCSPIDDLRVGTVGKPLANLHVKIAPDGEVLAKGSSIMLGYYKDEEATRKTFTEDGYLCTGDIGELVDGFLRIIERKKNILVLATGKNVAPFPVESAMSRSPFISQAILLGDKRKYVTALIVPDFESVQAWAQEHGVRYDSIAALLADEKVRALFDLEVAHHLEEFASFERPKKYTLLDHELTVDSGELTATLKVRTHVLVQHYQAEIEAMYADENKQSAAV